MKSMKTLVRVKQREIDELRRKQTLLETKREEVYKTIDMLAQRLADERKAALPQREIERGLIAHARGGLRADRQRIEKAEQQQQAAGHDQRALMAADLFEYGVHALAFRLAASPRSTTTTS
jgi:hypothetical protein